MDWLKVHVDVLLGKGSLLVCNKIAGSNLGGYLVTQICLLNKFFSN